MGSPWRLSITAVFARRPNGEEDGCPRQTTVAKTADWPRARYVEQWLTSAFGATSPTRGSRRRSAARPLRLLGSVQLESGAPNLSGRYPKNRDGGFDPHPTPTENGSGPSRQTSRWRKRPLGTRKLHFFLGRRQLSGTGRSSYDSELTLPAIISRWRSKAIALLSVQITPLPTQG